MKPIPADDWVAKPLVNVAAVAARAGVSESTVSRVLRGSDLVREITRRRVEAAIAELGFRPRRGAGGRDAGRHATIADVADLAGVGLATVSRVLNGSATVREASRQRVEAAIEELNYRPSTIARSLSLGRAMTLGVVIPFFVRPAA